MTDYNALAKQFGAVASNAPTASNAIDYDALAKQHGAISSAPAQQPTASSTATVAPEQDGTITGIKADEPTGVRDRFTRWMQNVSDDIKYGTDTTGVGTVLKKMGAHGVYNGNSKEVGDFMGSLPLGLARAGKGAGELTQPGQITQGVKDVVGGGLQAATIPSLMASPAGASKAAEGASDAVQAVKAAMPAAKIEKGADLFKSLKSTIGEHTVEMTDKLSDALGDIKEAVDTGTTLPTVINKFVTRIADLEQPPLTYSEARSFYSNVGDLAASDRMAMNGKALRILNNFRAALGDSIAATAEKAGKLHDYRTAMSTFAQGKHRQDQIAVATEIAKDVAINALKLGTVAEVVRGGRDIMSGGR